MTTGPCLLAPSYLSDMSRCCTKSSHLAQGYLSTGRAYLGRAYLPISAPAQGGSPTASGEGEPAGILAGLDGFTVSKETLSPRNAVTLGAIVTNLLSTSNKFLG